MVSFTPEDYILLRAAWPVRSVAEIGRMLGCSGNRVRTAAKAIGLYPTSMGSKNEPTKAQWVEIATQEAHRARVRPSDVMAGVRDRTTCYARWRAWQTLKTLNPHLSNAGIGRISGFDHTSVRNAFLRLDGMEPKSRLRGLTPRSGAE